MNLGTKYEIKSVKSGTLDRLDKLFSEKDSPIYKSKMTVGELMGFKTPDGVTNAERVYSMYSVSDFIGESWQSLLEKIKIQIDKYKAGDTSDPDSDMMLLKTGTPIAYPLEAVSESVPMSTFQISDNSEYNPIDDDFINSLSVKSEQYVKMAPIILLFSRAMYIMTEVNGGSKGRDIDMHSGSLLDITSQVTNLVHSKSNGMHESVTLSVTDTILLGEGAIYDPKYDWVYMLTTNKSKESDSVKESPTLLSSIVKEGDLILIKKNPTTEDRTALQLASEGGIMLLPPVIRQISFDSIARVQSVPFQRMIGTNRLTISCVGIQSILSIDGSSYKNQLYTSSKMEDDCGILYYEKTGIVRLKGVVVNRAFQVTFNSIETQILFILDYMYRMVGFSDIPNYIDNSRTESVKVDGVDQYQLSGLMRIITPVIDKTISDRKILSGELGNLYESLESQIMRFIPPVLSELIISRKNNITELVVRRPPFDLIGINHWINSKAVASIQSFDIISMDLSFDSRKYSWYRMDYRFYASLLGGDISWLIPAKLFDELFDLFGDSPMIVSNPFIDKILKTDSSEDINILQQIVKQSIVDLRYSIQSSVYLPFTRTGQITIAGYSDKIKDGNWIMNELTGEIMYVTSVVSNQAISNSGITNVMTISVERGMLYSNLNDYMNLITMPSIDINGSDMKKSISSMLSEWKVDKEILSKLLYNRDGKGWTLK